MVDRCMRMDSSRCDPSRITLDNFIPRNTFLLTTPTTSHNTELCLLLLYLQKRWKYLTRMKLLKQIKELASSTISESTCCWNTSTACINCVINSSNVMFAETRKVMLLPIVLLETVNITVSFEVLHSQVMGHLNVGGILQETSGIQHATNYCVLDQNSVLLWFFWLLFFGGS